MEHKIYTVDVVSITDEEKNKTEVGAIRKSVVVMFDILDQQLRNQNYLNN